MNQRILGVAVLLAGIFSSAYAGNGKITGHVTDSDTREPLIGVNIVIAGTSYGAATDIEGRFVILNVPPGAYDLRASSVGYQEQTITGLRVSADLTTEANFQLRATAVELSPVIIVAERPLVNKSATNAVRISTGEDLEKLPVRGVQGVVSLQPGIVFQNNQIYIRGGRADEVGYYLEGANTRNVLGQPLGLATAADAPINLSQVIPEALEEFQVQAGGYNAEYGGANAGIVRQTLRSGTPQFKGSLQVETDNFTKQNDQKLGTFSYGYSNYVLTLSGPIYSDKIKIFVAGENQFDRDFRTQFWDGFRFGNERGLGDLNGNGVIDGPLPNSSVSGDSVDHVEIKPGNIPGMSRNRFTGNGTLTFDFKPVIVRVGATMSRQTQFGSALPVENLFDLNRLPITESSDLLVNTKLTYAISPTVLAEANVFYGDNRNKTYDPDFGDNFLLYRDSLASSQFGYTFRNYTTGPQDYVLHGFPFRREGAPLTTFRKNRQNRIGGSADLTAQVGGVHELKAGLSFESYLIRLYSDNGAFLTYYVSDPDVARTPGRRRDFRTWDNSGGHNNYGYDVYGNEISKSFNTDDPATIDGPKRPQFWAAYVQDKIEFSDLIINAGLRFDRFDMNDFRFVDDPTTPSVVEGPDNPSVDQETFEYKATGIKKTDPFMAVSPRFGLSFPVTDRTVFHVQFGKFIQAPALNTIYISRSQQATTFTGGNYRPNPAGQDLDPERTTQYEIGFTQQFSDNASFDITGFYKDIRGQIQIVRQTTSPNSVAAAYNTLANGDFATTKGVEISIRLRRTNRFQGQVSYTYSDAKGTGSTTNGAVSTIENGTQYPSVISPLDFNQSHRGAVNIDFRFGDNDGGPILEKLGANVLFTFNSGHPFTLSTGGAGQQGPENGALIENDARASIPVEAIGQSTTPWNTNVDLRLDKTVALGPLGANFYIYVQNLLNTRNVLNVYRRSGNASDDGYLNNPELSGAVVAGNGPTYVEMYKAINLQNGQAYRRVTGNDLWGSPRQIRFGVKLEL
ncbi:MAG TPA: TonB-dependent receptor [Bacteroidota bacterium]